MMRQLVRRISLKRVGRVIIVSRPMGANCPVRSRVGLDDFGEVVRQAQQNTPLEGNDRDGDGPLGGAGDDHVELGGGRQGQDGQDGEAYSAQFHQPASGGG